MSVIDIPTWRKYIYEQIDTFNGIFASSAILGASIFKSKRTASDALALWNDSILQAKGIFGKVSTEKQTELARNVVIKIPFIFKKPMSLGESLLINDTSGGSSHILGYLSCISQTFPVYKDIEAHAKIAENYFKAFFQNAFKAQFSDYVYLVNGECYASGGLLDYIASDTFFHYQYINNSQINKIQIEDINGDGWKINILERETNNWCSFLINARRSILKDFDIHQNCICSNIASLAPSELNRRKPIGDQVTHLITIFDIQKTVNDLKNSLCENETFDILQKLLI